MADSESMHAEATYDFFNLKSQWVTVPNVRIHYHDEGSGVPLLLLHGSGPGVSAAANWWRIIPRLTESFRVLAPDIAGYGWTEVPDESYYGVRPWADQAVQFLDALGIPEVVLVGNSLGARLAMQLLVDHPDRVSGLVSMGAPAIDYVPPDPTQMEPFFTREGMKAGVRSLASEGFQIPQELLAYRDAIIDRPGETERFRAVSNARDTSVVEIRLTAEQLAAVTVPVLLLHGREDRVLPASGTIDTAQIMPTADLAVYAHCGHWAQFEREEEFLAATLGLVRRVLSERP